MIKEKNELIKERVELEKGRTKNIPYKFVDLLGGDIDYVTKSIWRIRKTQKISRKISKKLDKKWDYKNWNYTGNSVVDRLKWKLVNSTIIDEIKRILSDSSTPEEEYEFWDDILFDISKKHIVDYLDDIVTGDKYGIFWRSMCEPICLRTAKLGICEELTDKEIDFADKKIEAAMEAFCMDVDAWLDASDEDFSHDVLGILKNVSDDYNDTLRHVDYRIFNGFIPKFSRHTALKYYTMKVLGKHGDKLIWVSVLNGTPEEAVQAAIIKRRIDGLEVKNPHDVKEHRFEEYAKICKENDILTELKKEIEEMMAKENDDFDDEQEN